MISGIKVFERRAVRVGTTCADKDGLNLRMFVKILREGFFHRFGVADEVEVVSTDGVIDEAIDLWEGMFGDDIDGLEHVWQPPRELMLF